MDIHKPKPWHGVREFLKEYAIIVVGVLTALAAEQGVEWLHWRHRVEASERTLQRDLALVADFASERVAVGRCLDERLILIRDAILRSGDRWESALPTDTNQSLNGDFVYFPPHRVWATHAWENIGSDGTLAHFDPERARNFALLYRRIDGASAMAGREDDGDSELQVLASHPITLGPDARLRMLQTITRLQMTNGALVNNSRQILRQIQDAGYLPPLAETRARLAANAPSDFKCPYAEAALKDRVAQQFFTLGR